MTKKIECGWGYSSVVDNLPSLCEALGLIPKSVGKKNDKGNFYIYSK